MYKHFLDHAHRSEHMVYTAKKSIYISQCSFELSDRSIDGAARTRKPLGEREISILLLKKGFRFCDKMIRNSHFPRPAETDPYAPLFWVEKD